MVLLDTHVLLWWVSHDRRLSPRAVREIAKADTVLVSPVSLWEVATLVRRARIRLDRDVFAWASDVMSQERVDQAPLTSAASVSAGLLPDDFPGDPADRLLYATAKDMVVPLVSKDSWLRAYARSARDLTVVW